MTLFYEKALLDEGLAPFFIDEISDDLDDEEWVHHIELSADFWLAKILNPRTPIVATFHSQCYRHKKWGSFATVSLKLGEASCCLMSDHLIVISRNLKKIVLKKYRISGEYIPNGVPEYKKIELKNAGKWGIKENDFFLSVGRLVESKGVHYLIEAFNRLKTDKKLVIAGDELHPDGYEKMLRKMAAKNPNIIFTGNLDGNSRELAELFSNAYLFVQPSEIEGLSIALLEAMSYETATLVSDIPENLEAIANAGFSFENRNVDDLTEQLKMLLDNPKEVYEKAKEGKERVSKCYSWDVISKGVLDVYKKAKEEHLGYGKFFPRIKYAKRVLKKFL